MTDKNLKNYPWPSERYTLDHIFEDELNDENDTINLLEKIFSNATNAKFCDNPSWMDDSYIEEFDEDIMQNRDEEL